MLGRFVLILNGLFTMKFVAIVTFTAFFALFLKSVWRSLTLSIHSLLYFLSYFKSVFVNLFNIISPIFPVNFLWIRRIFTLRTILLFPLNQIVLECDLFTFKRGGIRVWINYVLCLFEIRFNLNLFFVDLSIFVVQLISVSLSNVFNVLLWWDLFNKAYNSFSLGNPLLNFLLLEL